jgi:AraC-like DNA-binding protein
MTVVQSCILTSGKTGVMFLENHLLLLVIHGTYKVRYNNEQYVINKNEFVLIKKAVSIEYEKSGASSDCSQLEYMMFFLKDEFLNEFLNEFEQKIKAQISIDSELEPVSVFKADSRLLGFIESIKPFFAEKDPVDENLVKLKIFELLYDIGNINHTLLYQLLQLSSVTPQNLSYVLENNYMNPVSLKDLAYLSGRSLSSFKRDFNNIYKIPPSEWIREKRLTRAKELLATTEMSVTDVCFATGFANVSHFSRLFKERYGYSPSYHRKN